ncbi:MAG TPA: hypothetical protein DEP20_02385 [Fusobacteria bacterium]|nr:hypothetical protein [Fusobacteriota bacterium]|tara:strand:+ start:16105 stop:17394 length:1290 start_codon:yes stop_codon:yes gene_type:complete
MIFLIFLLLFKTGLSLTLDEALSLYKSRSFSSKSLEVERDIYRRSYDEYARCKWFTISLSDSGSSYVNYRRDEDHTFKDHFVRNTLTPQLNLAGISLYTNWRSDYAIETKDFDNKFVSLGAKTNLTNMFYSSSSYSSDMAYLNMKMNDISSSMKDFDNISKIIDIFSTVKVYEGRIDIKERAIDQLRKDREYTEDRLKAGLASGMDIKSLDLEISMLNQELQEIYRDMYISKRQLCLLIGIEFDDQQFAEIESQDIENVLVDSRDINLLEYELESDKKQRSLELRNLLPDLFISAEYDWNEVLERYDGVYGLSVSWDVTPNLSSYNQACKKVELGEEKLANAKLNKSLELEKKRGEYLSAREAIESALQEKEYWEQVVEVQREMYKNDLISLQDYLKYFNKLRDKEISLSEKRYQIEAFKRKIKVLEEL